MGRPRFDGPGWHLDTVLCLILPGKHAKTPERVRAWLKVAQQLALGADLLAWGPGHPPPPRRRDVIIYQGSLIMNKVKGSVMQAAGPK